MIISEIDLKKAKCIVEYGPDAGVLNRELIKRKKDDTVLLVLELNMDLYDILQHFMTVYLMIF